MAIYQTMEYAVAPEAVASVTRAIDQYIHDVRASKPSTRIYAACQQLNDPTRFVHLLIFDDDAARSAHGRSTAAARFERACRPHRVDGEIVVTVTTSRR